MGFEIVVSWKDTCCEELFLENGNELEEILRVAVTDIVYCVWRNRESVLAYLLYRGLLHHADNISLVTWPFVPRFTMMLPNSSAVFRRPVAVTLNVA